MHARYFFGQIAKIKVILCTQFDPTGTVMSQTVGALENLHLQYPIALANFIFIAFATAEVAPAVFHLGNTTSTILLKLN